jgi:hypothetical protein
MAFNLRNRHFLKLIDFTSQEIKSGLKSCDFLYTDGWVSKATGNRGVICQPKDIEKAIAGEAGTEIV